VRPFDLNRSLSFFSVKLREKKYGVSKNQEKQKIQDREQQNDEDEGHEPFLENNNPRYAQIRHLEWL